MQSAGATRKVAAGAAAFFAVLALGSVAPAPAAAQDPATPPQQAPGRVQVDSIEVVGNERIAAPSVLGTFAVQPGEATDFREIQAGVKALMGTGQFSDVRVRAREEGARVILVVEVDEQPLVRRVNITGLQHADAGDVQDTTGLRPGEPYSPAEVQRARAFIRDELSAEGIPFADIDERLVPVEGLPNVVDLVLEVTEGNRVTVADVVVQGNERVSTDDIVGVMATKPEGFWWFRTGSYDQEQYVQDLTGSIPGLYRSRGFLEFEVLSDSLVIDPESGKARIEIEVHEGPRYVVADFEIEGNREFSDTLLASYFRPESGGLLRGLGIGGGGDGRAEGRVFNEVAFQAAAQRIQELYANRGYIYAEVRPQVTRNVPEDPDDPHTVDLAWQIREGIPAYINTVAVVGNDYTYDWVVRDKIFVLPGDVYSQERVIQSYQSISSLGFFETPMPPPDIQPDRETGNVDITFRVEEKQTGSINFGTSVGGGVGLAGFLGYEQPNLFGQAKSGRLRWDFGRYLSNFELSYSDPALFQSRVSGSLSLFNSRDRFIQFNTGRRKRIGASLRFGFPIPGALRTRVFAGYSIARTKYQLFSGVDDRSLFGRDPGTQSTLLLGVTRSTLNHPLFPTTGSRLSLNSEFNGGLLGGDGDFAKHVVEASWWTPVGQLGGSGPQSRPIRFALGLSMRAGGVFGNAENFPFDRFWMGGVQFGEQLRGYDETTITPLGYFPKGRQVAINEIDRLGDAFLALTAEYALRLNDNISISTFFDAGNVWSDPTDIDPTRLFRGAGVGLQLVTPFGPIGLDYAYGFDKPTPGWQLFFRMGPGF